MQTKKFITVFVLLGSLVSCNNGKLKFDYQTSIASKLYVAQIQYLDKTIYNYSRISNQGKSFYNESKYLDSFTNVLKTKIGKGLAISDSDKIYLFQPFEKVFYEKVLIDKQIFNSIKESPIISISDVDLLKLYLKNNLVCILLNNKLLPFDHWGTRANVIKNTINYGEEFQVDLMTIASSQEPTEWFLLKNGATEINKRTIIDTLHPNFMGEIQFKTKDYLVGKNTLTFISRLNNDGLRDKTIRKVIEFYVN